MSRPRIFVDTEAGAEVLALDGRDHHYLTRVRRLSVGSAVEVVDPAGTAALYCVERVTSDRVRLALEAPLKRRILPGVLSLVQPLLQRKKLELAVQKATELGVDHLWLNHADRSVARWTPDEHGSRLERLERIALEASRQSRRDAPPALDILEGLHTIGAPRDGERRLLLVEHSVEEALCLSDLTKGETSRRVLVAVGPEGGLTQRELEILSTEGFEPIHLGPLVLRTETASVLACVAGGLALGRYTRDCP